MADPAITKTDTANSFPIVPDRGDRNARRKSASLAISIVAHGLLFTLTIFLFTFFRTPSEGSVRKGGIVLTEIGELDTPKFLDENDVIEEELEKQLAAVQAAAAAPAPPTIEIPQIPDLPGPSPIIDAPGVTDIVNDRLLDKPSNHYEISEADLKEIAKEQRRLLASLPKGDPTSVSIFNGTKMTGRRFVFILDRSQSMGGNGLGVLAEAQKELTAAINQLKPNHSFQIVAYHSQTVTISKRQLLAATAENKVLAKPFLERLAAFGATEHTYGITAGLAFRPDTVVLMTDGGYPGLSAAEMKEVRKMAKNVEFHCIQFGLGPRQTNVNFMTKLAGECNGTYRYVDVRSWK